MEWVNGWPRLLGAPLEAVMQLGTLGGALVVLAAVAVATIRTRPLAIVAVGLAVVTGWKVDNLLKAVVDRPRPPAVVSTLTVRDHADGSAYPSGHTTLAVAVAVAVLPLLPHRWRPVAIGLAVAVAVARMYVGVHWPTDLVGGAALGTLLAGLSWALVDLAAPKGPDDADYGPDHP